MVIIFSRNNNNGRVPTHDPVRSAPSTISSWEDPFPRSWVTIWSAGPAPHDRPCAACGVARRVPPTDPILAREVRGCAPTAQCNSCPGGSRHLHGAPGTTWASMQQRHIPVRGRDVTCSRASMARGGAWPRSSWTRRIVIREKYHNGTICPVHTDDPNRCVYP